MGARIRNWWRRAGGAQADGVLFVIYYSILPLFAWLARRDRGGLHDRGWTAHDATPPSTGGLRRQH